MPASYEPSHPLRILQQNALDRARRYHLLCIAETGEVLTPEDEAEITTHMLWQLPLQGDGWYDAGSVDDHHGGIIGAMRVLWHIESDRVRVKRTLALAPKPPPPEHRPIWHDGNYRYTVDDGYRYWLGDVAYTPEQVRQIVGYRDGVRSADWRWERIED